MTKGLPGDVASESSKKGEKAELRECPPSLKRRQEKKMYNTEFTGLYFWMNTLQMGRRFAEKMYLLKKRGQSLRVRF